MEEMEKSNSIKKPKLCGNNPIFIGCMPRSGSSLLRLMLDSHPSIDADKEIHWTKDGINRARRLLKQSYGRVANGGRYLNKEPACLTVRGLRMLYQLMESDYYFIHIKRHPYDTLISYAKTKWDIEYVGSTVPALFQSNAKNFMEGYRYLSRIRPSHYYEVSYESLILKPAKTIIALCEFLGIKFNKSMLNHHKKEHVVVDHYSDKQAVKPIFKNSLHQYEKFVRDNGWNPGKKIIKICDAMCETLGYKPIVLKKS